MSLACCLSADCLIQDLFLFYVFPLDRIMNQTKTPSSNVSFNSREVPYFRALEQDLVRKTRMTKSAVYKQALREYHGKHFTHQM